MDQIILTPEDVDDHLRGHPGLVGSQRKQPDRALDITLTDELRQEGIARDLVNRIQNLRKDMGTGSAGQN